MFLACTHTHTCTRTHMLHDLIVDPNTQRSIAEVEWGTSGSSNIYRVGHKGKVDLKCDTPGDGGEYYPDHLPMSGGFALYHMCTYTYRVMSSSMSSAVCIQAFQVSIRE